MGRSLPLALGLRVGFSLALGVRVLLALVFWGVMGLVVGVRVRLPGFGVSGWGWCRGARFLR